MKYSVICLAMLALIVAGCSNYRSKSKKVILQHPETMEFVDCQVDAWGTPGSFAENEKCVQEYQQQGYVIWGKY